MRCALIQICRTKSVHDVGSASALFRRVGCDGHKIAATPYSLSIEIRIIGMLITAK